MGAVEDGIIKQCLKTGKELPPKVKNRPELKFGLYLYWKVFFELTSDRVNGFELGPIPSMTILAYCDRYDLDDYFTLEYVRAMDNAFLKYHQNKQKRESDMAKRKMKNG